MRKRLKKIWFRIIDFIIRPSKEELTRRKKYEDYAYLRSRGVETELGYVHLVGRPSIERAEGARIIIGQGVTLVSEPTANTAGINHPVILSAEGHGSIIKIGNGVGISGASIVTCSEIEIGDDTMIGANCNIYGTDFHFVEADKRLAQSSTADAPTAPIKIGKRCWLASNVTVLKGISIGDEAVVGAMSLVTKDVDTKTIVAGVPAKKIKEI
jgi:acetyltransferase-like isoleucine patch superfamily enzyme